VVFEPVEGHNRKVFEVHYAVAVYVAGDNRLANRDFGDVGKEGLNSKTPVFSKKGCSFFSK
jgi:hypothetical protein